MRQKFKIVYATELAASTRMQSKSINHNQIPLGTCLLTKDLIKITLLMISRYGLKKWQQSKSTSSANVWLNSIEMLNAGNTWKNTKTTMIGENKSEETNTNAALLQVAVTAMTFLTHNMTQATKATCSSRPKQTNK